MNWNAIGAVAELLGAIGVVVTLVFLTRQIRENTKTVRAATNHALTVQRNELNLQFGLDADAVELLLKGAEDASSLDPISRYRYMLLMRAVIGVCEDTYVQYKEGMCEADVWEASLYVMRPIVSAKQFGYFWKRNASAYRLDFQREIERVFGIAPE